MSSLNAEILPDGSTKDNPDPFIAVYGKAFNRSSFLDEIPPVEVSLLCFRVGEILRSGCPFYIKDQVIFDNEICVSRGEEAHSLMIYDSKLNETQLSIQERVQYFVHQTYHVVGYPTGSVLPRYHRLNPLNVPRYCRQVTLAMSSEESITLHQQLDPAFMVCRYLNFTSHPAIGDPTLFQGPNDFVPPWAHCRLVFNEINTDTPDKNLYKFIELIQLCNENKYSRGNKLTGFRVITINGLSRHVVMSKDLSRNELRQFKQSRKIYKFLTIGSEAVENVDVTLANVPMVDSNYIPSGLDWPYAVILLFSSKRDLKEFNLPLVDGNYQQLPIDDQILTLIQLYIQDIVVFGANPLTQDCSIFKEIYPPFESIDLYLLRDWQSDPHAKDLSLNRCTEEFQPVLPHSFMYAKPTPGRPNDCNNAFPFRLEEHLDDVADLIDLVVGSNPTDAECRNRLYTPLTYQSVDRNLHARELAAVEENLAGLYMMVEPHDDANVQAEIDIIDDIVAAIPHPVSVHEWKCSDRNPFDLHPVWKDSIIQHQSDLIDLKTVTNCKVKPWFWYTPAEEPRLSKYKCAFCIQAIAKGHISLRPGRVDAIMKEDGTLVIEGDDLKWRNTVRMTRHADHPFHKIAVSYMMESARVESEKDLILAIEDPKSEIRSYYRATEYVLAAVYQAVQINLSFEQYEGLIRFIKDYYKIEVGTHYHDATSMQRIAVLISNQMHDRLVKHLIKEQPEISLIIDASEDISGKHYLAVLFQTFDQNDRPHVFFYKLLVIGVSETAEALFKLVWDAIIKDGLEEYMKAKLRGYSSDGANVVRAAFLRLLKRKTNDQILGVHCSAHRLDLVTKHAFKAFPFLLHLDAVINDQYNYLGSRSLKLQAKLQSIIDELDDSFFRLHRLYPVRWISTKFDALKNIINHWYAIVMTYKSVQTDPVFNLPQKNRAAQLERELKLRPVLITFAFVEDLCGIFKYFSLQFQRERSTPVPFKEFKKDLHDRLEKLKGEHGATMVNIMASLDCVLDGQQYKPCTLNVYENPRSVVKFHGEEMQFIESEDYPLLSNSIASYVDALHGELLHYFPDDIYDSFAIFHPQSIPTPHEVWDNF
jgi:hypothetical protein